MFFLTRTSLQRKLNCMENDSAGPTPSYAQRAAAYWSVDGLPEILRGLTFVILFAVPCLWRIYAPAHWPRAGALISFTGLFLYFFGAERIVLDFLKSRITYPRTGYVQPPEQDWFGSRTPVPLSLRPSQPYFLSTFSPSPTVSENATSFWPGNVRPLLGFSVLCMFGQDLLGHWLVPIAMPALAVTLYVVNRNSERPYSWWWALILALTGLVSLWVDVPAALLGWLPFLLAGGWLVALGAYTLVNYLRMNPYPRTPDGVKA
jgi:hypothetical protein